MNILNTIFISIPEEFFITMMILLIANKFKIKNTGKILDTYNWKQNLLKILMISVIPMSIISELLNLLSINQFIIMILGVILTELTILLILKSYSIKKIIILFLITIFVFSIVNVLTIFCMMIFCRILKNIEINQVSILYRFLIMLPARVCQYSLIYLILSKKENIKINVIIQILKNKKVFISCLLLLSIIIMLCIIFFKYVIVNNCLTNITLNEKILFCSIYLSCPFLCWLLLWNIFHKTYIEIKYKKLKEEIQ